MLFDEAYIHFNPYHLCSVLTVLYSSLMTIVIDKSQDVTRAVCGHFSECYKVQVTKTLTQA